VGGVVFAGSTPTVGDGDDGPQLLLLPVHITHRIRHTNRLEDAVLIGRGEAGRLFVVCN